MALRKSSLQPTYYTAPAWSRYPTKNTIPINRDFGMAQVARTLETVYTAIPAREIANADDFDDNDPVVAAAAAADAAVAAITDKSTQSTMDALSSSCLSTADGTFLSYFSFVCVRVAYFAFAQSIHQKNLKNDRREGQKLSQTQTR